MTTNPKIGDVFAYRGLHDRMLFDEHVRYVGRDGRLVVVSSPQGDRGAVFAWVYPSELVAVDGRCICETCCP